MAVCLICILSVLNFPSVSHIYIYLLWLTLCLLWLLVMSMSCAWGSCQSWNDQTCDPVKQQTWWLEPRMPVITVTNSITDVYKRSCQTLFILTRYDWTNMAVGFPVVKNPLLCATSLQPLLVLRTAPCSTRLCPFLKANAAAGIGAGQLGKGRVGQPGCHLGSLLDGSSCILQTSKGATTNTLRRSREDRQKM